MRTHSVRGKGKETEMSRKSKSDLKVLESAMGALLAIVSAMVELLRKRGVSLEQVYVLSRPEGAVLLEKITDAVALVLAPTKAAVVDMATPWIPEAFTLEKNDVEGELSVENIGGELYVNGRKVVPYLHEKQMGGGSIVGTDLERELKGKPVLGSALLRHLIENPKLVPDSWKGKYLFFWGTKLRPSTGRRCVLCIYWYDEQWQWDYCWLDDGWGGYNPALVLE